MRVSLLISLCLLLAVTSTPMSIQNGTEISDTVQELTSHLIKGLSSLGQISNENSGNLIFAFVDSVKGKLKDKDILKTLVDSLGIQQDFVKPLEKMIDLAGKLDFQVPVPLSLGDNVDISNIMSALIKMGNETVNKNDAVKSIILGELHIPPELNNLIDAAKDNLVKSFDSGVGLSNGLSDVEEVNYDTISASASNIWMVIKSIWEKILTHIREENSLSVFMELTPVKFINQFLSLGDNVNLMNFLAQKLDPKLAEFIASKMNPYLGPIQDFESLYNFLKEKGLNGILDYFGTKRFRYTFDTMTKVASAYLEDTVTDDIVSQYIEFISFNNTELQRFYNSVLNNLKKTNKIHSDTLDESSNRIKRDILQDIASIYKFNDNTEYASPEGSPLSYARESAYSSRTGNYAQAPSAYSQESGHYQTSGSNSSPASSNDVGNYNYYTENSTDAATVTQNSSNLDPASRQLSRYGVSTAGLYYDPSRDGYGYGGGGYGGGGYGGSHGGMTMDPYMILGSLILGTLLGFLLFRALRATRGGRRDINDGSLSLWDSDVPNNFWGSSNADRMKRSILNSNSTSKEEFNLPASLRGEKWSTDPLIGDEFFDELFEEDDVADHLNNLWQIYQDTNETSCVQSHLCDFMTSRTAGSLTSKDSSTSLLMASLSNMIGLAGSGKLVDDVTQNLVIGNSYSCPSSASCNFSL